VHIHFKIRPTSSSEFTSQLFFDDAQVGRILSRREVLAFLGGSSAALLAACTPGGLTSA